VTDYRYTLNTGLTGLPTTDDDNYDYESKAFVPPGKGPSKACNDGTMADARSQADCCQGLSYCSNLNKCVGVSHGGGNVCGN
jgi:hypothetical protein